MEYRISKEELGNDWLYSTLIALDKCMAAHDLPLYARKTGIYLVISEKVITFAPDRSVLWKLSKLGKNKELSSFPNRYLPKSQRR